MRSTELIRTHHELAARSNVPPQAVLGVRDISNQNRRHTILELLQFAVLQVYRDVVRLLVAFLGYSLELVEVERLQRVVVADDRFGRFSLGVAILDRTAQLCVDLISYEPPVLCFRHLVFWLLTRYNYFR